MTREGPTDVPEWFEGWMREDARVLPEPDWAAMAEEAWRERCEAAGVDPDSPDVIEAAIAREESAAYDRIP